MPGAVGSWKARKGLSPRALETAEPHCCHFVLACSSEWEKKNLSQTHHLCANLLW